MYRRSFTQVSVVLLFVSIVASNIMPMAQGFTTNPSSINLADRCISQWETHQANLPNNQLFVGVAGGPGSGKTTTCTDVADEIRRKRHDISIIVVPMDGFHYHTDELQELAASKWDMTFDEVMLHRGAPWTFDAAACAKAFHQARRDGQASLPVYDRSISNPVPDGVKIDKDTCIVIFEGLYLLAFDDPDWAPLQDVFDDTWYVECETPETQKSRLIGRHMKNWTNRKIELWGEGEEGARKKVDSADWKNVVWIAERSRHAAKLIVQT